MDAASTRASPTSNVSRSAAACAHVNARSRRACSSASRRSRGVRRRDPTSRKVAAKASSSMTFLGISSETPNATKSNRRTPLVGSVSGHAIATGSSLTASPSSVRLTIFCRPPDRVSRAWSTENIAAAMSLCAPSARSKTCLPSGLVVSNARNVPGAACVARANSDWSTGTASPALPFLPPFFAAPFFPLAPFLPFFAFLPPPSARKRRSPSARAAAAASSVRASTSETARRDDATSAISFFSSSLFSFFFRRAIDASSARSNDAHPSAPMSLPSRHTETRRVFFANASANAFAAALPNRVRLKSKETTDAFRASASAIATHPASSKPLRAKTRRSTLVASDRERSRIADAIAIASATPKPFAETSTSTHGEVSRNAASATADFAPSAFSARFILVRRGHSASAASTTAPSASRTSHPRSSTTARPAGHTT